tara:strand:- start:5035 stop:5424 length:390 start_codon:yes stop_codon:yes gene_type:complete
VKSAYCCFTKNLFEERPFVPFGFEWSLLEFKIQSFLNISTFLDKEERPHARNAFNAGYPFFLLPHLVTQESKVIEHAGRHRATVLLDNKFTHMPVLFYWSGEKPLYLKAQDGAKDPNYSIPFPPHFLTP